MRAICLVDTSIFVEFLNVPIMATNTQQIVAEVKQKVAEDQRLFLPMATIMETGNHIGQNGDGNQRRQCGERFVRQVQLAINNESPFAPINFVEAHQMQRVQQILADPPTPHLSNQQSRDIRAIEERAMQSCQ